MSDLSTLLLLTCTQCLDTAPSPAQKDTYTCTNTQGQNPKNQSVESSSQCISPPEALPPSLESNSFATKISQRINLGSRESGVSEGGQGDGETGRRGNKEDSVKSSPATSSSPSPHHLRSGSQGEVVKRLQTKLKQLGYYNGAVDGVYGPLTRNAVSKFQQAQGLNVDGIVGTQTLAKLPQPSPKPALTEKSKEAEIEKNASSKPSDQTPAVVPKQETSPKQPNLAFVGTQPQYLWLWGWAIFVTGGYIVLLKPSSYQLPSIKENKPSVSNEEDKLVSPVQVEIADIAQTKPVEREDLAQPIVQTNPVEKKDIPPARGRYCLLAAKPDNSTYILRQNLKELGVGSRESGSTFFSSSPSASLSPHLSPSPNSNNTLNCYALVCDQKGKIYMSERLKTQSEQASSLIDSTNIWHYIFEEEALPALPLDSTPRLLLPTWAVSDLLEPIEDLSYNSPPATNQSTPEQTSKKVSVEQEDKTSPQTNSQETSKKTSVEQKDKTSPQTNSQEDNHSPTTLVGTLPTTDQNTGETYIYSLVDDAGGLFVLNGNKLLLLNQALPDTAVDSTYNIKLRRTNNQGMSVDKAFKVAVK
ncbi:MAG: peptidoglycan-binding protein [Coleofasciculaceae cyanobacterium]